MNCSLLLSRHEEKPERALGNLQSVGMLFIIFTLNSIISSVGTPYSSFPPIKAKQSSNIGTIYDFVLLPIEFSPPSKSKFLHMPLATSNTSMEVTYLSSKPDIVKMYSSFIFIRFSMLIEVLPPALST
jgi:hypothetical protein